MATQTKNLKLSSTAYSLEAVQTAAQELKRRKFIRNLYAFNNELLGYADMREQPHRLMCDSVSSGSKRKMHQWPRGTFKSTMITVGYVVKRICENPNIRILIANVNLANSQSFLREIKGHFERNEELKRLYGDHVSSDKWTDSQIISAKRTKNLKEPTVQVAGVGQGLASQHYDLIVADDLVNELTVTTPEQIQKTISWFKMAYSLLEPDGEFIDIGTRYHQADLHGYIERELSDEFDIQVHSIFLNDDPDQGTIFPDRFTPEVVAAIRKAQGSYIFNCQYRNNPINQENAKFKMDDFRYFKEDELERMTLYTTLTLDRAYSLSQAADFSGVTVRSQDSEGNWYVRYAKRHKKTEGELIDLLFDLKSYYRVDKVGIEQKAFKYTLEPTLQREMRRRETFFTVIELKDQTAKIRRIEGLVPLFESHSIYFLKDEMTDLEDELTNFPTATHDDLADALAYHDAPELRRMAMSTTKQASVREAMARAQAGLL